MKEGQIARVNVINVSKDGAFVDVGGTWDFHAFCWDRGKLKIGEKVWVKL